MWRIGLIVFSAVLTQAVGQYASKCQLPDEQAGLCMPVKSCKSIYELFQKIQTNGGSVSTADRQHFTQLHCGTFKNVAHVCCSESDIQLNPDGLDILKNQSCGVYTVDKISFGVEAALSGFPWMALLIYNDTHDPYRCGGALISEQYVLTAAHCIQDELHIVRLGEHRISTDPDCIAGGKICAPAAVNVDIEETTIHPQYRRSFHDIALIRLKRIIQPQRHIKPICLPIYDYLRGVSHDEYIISGWGRTQNGKVYGSVLEATTLLHRYPFAKLPTPIIVSVSDVLMAAKVPLVQRPQCQMIMQRYRLRLPLSYGHICAGNRNLMDSCDGDSGGPMGFKDMYENHPRFVQYGVVSFGVNYCGEGNSPNIYTNVSHYLQWITDNMRN